MLFCLTVVCFFCSTVKLTIEKNNIAVVLIKVWPAIFAIMKKMILKANNRLS